MRVALVSHYMPPHIGGVEQVAALLARVYTEAGHDVTWIGCATPLVPGEEREGHLRTVRLPAFNALEPTLAMPYPVIGPTGYHRIGEVVANSDVVHVHDCLYTTSLAADRAAARLRRPMLVTQHVAMATFLGGLVDPLLCAAYRTVGRGVLRHARRVAFVSESVRDWFLAHVAVDLPTVVTPSAVDTSRFRPPTPSERAAARDALGLPADAPHVLFAGRLAPVKNIRVLASAVAATDARLLVVGDGPERDALHTLGDRVTHVPRFPHERMPTAYWAADLFALPSSREAMPVSLMEALASGLRCVVSRDSAFERLALCEAVIRVPVSPDSLARALISIIGEDAASQARRAAAARAWAERHYGVAAFADRSLRLLAEVAAD